MKKELKLFLFVSCFLPLIGCSGYTYFEPQAPQSPAPAQTPQVSQNIPSSSTHLVEASETAADYKAFGERTPRDQYVVDGGAGSNLSSAIPPIQGIEEEVVDYEESVEIEEGQNSGNSSSDNSAVDDPVEDWLAEEGKTLKGLLTEWSDRAGWRLVWNTNRNYTLTAGAMFRGRFADVSSALIRAFARAKPAPVATFYKGNRVLVVETMEDENAYE